MTEEHKQDDVESVEDVEKEHHVEHEKHTETKEIHTEQKTQNKSEEITINEVTLWKGATAVLLLLLAISVFTGGFGRGTTGAAVVDLKEDNPSIPSADLVKLMDDDSVKGDANAPVTIIEWSDFECPFCVRFYEQTFKQIDEKYIKTGKVKMVFRDFPLSFHTNAQKAAESAECAGEQDKFWEMHNLLFEKGVSGGVSAFKQYAVDIGIDTAEFNECLDTGAMASEVAKDMQDGSSAGIRGTPGFIINGKLISGAQPFSVFEAAIDEALQG